ncbi:LysR family transcriptional regulator [Mesosutterella sp. AGMB02718]|uniref:LysR family transcriptional regulator n=1 Tax=Mesosutterella faecium TaxID=2925194 RepID=A0ABT7INI3_9BURK|nr:LysR family transcriptional regulator [Mesosutterella sp. AGMB02718]MDL2059939.1 LysR family transcriptional regulator [Mesosutterella sp. AGMB02718]
MSKNSKNPTLSLSRLQLLESIFRNRSLSAAAKECGLSVSAASRQLSQAREDFEDELFVRSGYDMIPTDRMSELEEELAPLLSRLQSLTDKEDFDPSKIQKTFRIMTADNGFIAFIAPALKDINRQAPRASIEILNLSPDRLGEFLREGRADLAIMPRVPAAADLASLPLARIRKHIMMRRDHPLALDLIRNGVSSLTIEKIIRWPQAYTSLTPQAKILKLEEAPCHLSFPYLNSSPAVLLDTDYIDWVPESSVKYWERIPGLISFELPDSICPPFTPKLIWSRRSSGNPENVWLRSLIIGKARENYGPAPEP